ncbi:unnamed protein product, partial [Owenia fusiformis]
NFPTVSQERDQVFQSMQEMFKDKIDPEVVHMVLAASDWKVETAFETLMGFSTSSEPTSLPPGGPTLKSASAILTQSPAKLSDPEEQLFPSNLSSGDVTAGASWDPLGDISRNYSGDIFDPDRETVKVQSYGSNLAKEGQDENFFTKSENLTVIDKLKQDNLLLKSKQKSTVKESPKNITQLTALAKSAVLNLQKSNENVPIVNTVESFNSDKFISGSDLINDPKLGPGLDFELSPSIKKPNLPVSNTTIDVNSLTDVIKNTTQLQGMCQLTSNNTSDKLRNASEGQTKRTKKQAQSTKKQTESTIKQTGTMDIQPITSPPELQQLAQNEVFNMTQNNKMKSRNLLGNGGDISSTVSVSLSQIQRNVSNPQETRLVVDPPKVQGNVPDPQVPRLVVDPPKVQRRVLTDIPTTRENTTEKSQENNTVSFNINAPAFVPSFLQGQIFSQPQTGTKPNAEGMQTFVTVKANVQHPRGPHSPRLDFRNAMTRPQHPSVLNTPHGVIPKVLPQRFGQPRFPARISFSKPMEKRLAKIRQLVQSGRKVMVLMRGCPGSGKSTLAQAIVCKGVVLSTDDFFIQQDGRYEFNPSLIGEAHTWNQERAQKALDKGRSPVVIDNTNTQAWEMTTYIQMASKRKYDIEILEPDTSWKFNVKELARRNTHGVPKDRLKDMVDRYDRNVTVDSILQSPKPQRPSKPSATKATDKLDIARDQNKDAKAESESNYQKHDKQPPHDTPLEDSPILSVTHPKSNIENPGLNQSFEDDKDIIDLDKEFEQFQLNEKQQENVLVHSSVANWGIPASVHALDSWKADPPIPNAKSDKSENLKKIPIEVTQTLPKAQRVNLQRRNRDAANVAVQTAKDDDGEVRTSDQSASGEQSGVEDLDIATYIDEVVFPSQSKTSQSSKYSSPSSGTPQVSPTSKLAYTSPKKVNRKEVVPSVQLDQNVRDKLLTQNWGLQPLERNLSKSPSPDRTAIPTVKTRQISCQTYANDFTKCESGSLNILNADFQTVLWCSSRDINKSTNTNNATYAPSQIHIGCQTDDSDELKWDDKVKELILAFPDVPEDQVDDLLKQYGGDIDLVTHVLLDSDLFYCKTTPADSQRSTPTTTKYLLTQGPGDVVIEENTEMSTPACGNAEAIAPAFDSHLVTYPVRATTDNSDSDDEDDLSSLSLTLEPKLARKLEKMFGPVIKKPNRGGQNEAEDYVVILNKHTAKQIHRRWKLTLEDRILWNEAEIQNMLKEDEELARSLQEKEDFELMKTEQLQANFTPGRPMVSTVQSVIATNSPLNTAGNEAVSLRDIMNEEMAVQMSRNEMKSTPSPFGAEGNIATKLKRQQLLAMFPTLDASLLNGLFEANGYSLDATIKALYDSNDQTGPATTVMTDHAYEQQMVKQAKIESLSEYQLNNIEADTAYQSIENPEYFDYRGEAVMHYRRRAECFEKAKEAYKRGMRQVASYYSQQGHLHTEKLKEANRRASERIVEERNVEQDENTLDLHGLHVDEALDCLKNTIIQREHDLHGLHVDEALDCLKNTVIQREHELRDYPNKRMIHLNVITGRGLHSRGGQAKIRPAVCDYLRRNNYKYTEPNAGIVKLLMKHRDPNS